MYSQTKAVRQPMVFFIFGIFPRMIRCFRQRMVDGGPLFFGNLIFIEAMPCSSNR